MPISHFFARSDDALVAVVPLVWAGAGFAVDALARLARVGVATGGFFRCGILRMGVGGRIRMSAIVMNVLPRFIREVVGSLFPLVTVEYTLIFVIFANVRPRGVLTWGWAIGLGLAGIFADG